MSRYKIENIKFSLVLTFALLLLLAGILHFTHKKEDSQVKSPISSADLQSLTINESEAKKFKIITTATADDANGIVEAYVPVTNFYSTLHETSLAELKKNGFSIDKNIPDSVIKDIEKYIGVDTSRINKVDIEDANLDKNTVTLIPASKLQAYQRLLRMDGSYYLDGFKTGAIMRQVINKSGKSQNITKFPYKSSTVATINMTGTTALTRRLIQKYNETKDGSYFAEKIGPYLSAADITHVSNEVSFRPGCEIASMSFCSPPGMIGALEKSGVDVVELDGNHNNDQGSTYNADTIRLYHSKGWKTFGGGLNDLEAKKPYIAEVKGSKIGFLGYNFADGAQSDVMAKTNSAGGNPFSYEQAAQDIAELKKQVDFVVVDIQYLECYAYPDGFVEYPECDKPIKYQTDDFRKITQLGADMVIGNQAHHPQTFEYYNKSPIYYGLGNLYFDQTNWPGTERGLILTHYFYRGKLLQTKIAPTQYDKSYQTALMPKPQADAFIDRLLQSRPQ